MEKIERRGREEGNRYIERVNKKINFKIFMTNFKKKYHTERRAREIEKSGGESSWGKEVVPQ